MTCVTNLAKTWFCVNNRQACDHLVNVSINTMKYLNGPHNGCIILQMSHWILSRNFSGFICIMRGKGHKINFPVAHAVQIKSDCLRNLASLKLWHAIDNDLPHHPYSRMSYSIMPGLEYINILKNHFIRNMWNMFNVCVVQSWLQGRYSFKNIMTISVRFSNEEKLLIIFLMSYDMQSILTDISIA
jgi:hypothetical protein